MSWEKVGWSHLPDDLLALLAKRMTTLSNLIRFATLCREWRRVAEGDIFSFRLPMLMLPVSSRYIELAFGLYCPSTKDFQELHLHPDMNMDTRTQTVGGSHNGWLLEAFNTKMDLVNPLLQRQVELPSFNTLTVIHKAALSHSNRRGEEFMVMAIANCKYGSQVLLARPGDESWEEAFPHRDWFFEDIMYHREQFYAVTNGGRLVAWKECKGQSALHLSFIIRRPLPSRYLMFEYQILSRKYKLSKRVLAKTSKGELLFIRMYLVLERDMEVAKDQSHWFQVFKLEEKNGAPPSWLKVKSLGEDTLFLSENMSIPMAGASSAGCRENCIYFPTRYSYRNCVAVYSMEEKRIVDHYPVSWIPGGYFPYYLGENECQWIWDRKI